jgi:molybdate transport system substrate-binding protein
MYRGLFVFLLVLLLFPSASAQGAELTVSAAISLREGFQRIAREFEAAHPGYRLALNFASSGHLQRQIERGAPVDVFASAANRQMDALAKAKQLHPGSRKVFATNRLVLIRPKKSGFVKSFATLGRDFRGRLVIGNPAHVPAGSYAKQLLESLGYWKSLQPKLVLSDHVRQVLDYVSRGEVDAGIVYRTDALNGKKRVHVVEEAPSGSHKPIEYPIAIVAGTRHLDGAKAFLRFVIGERGQQILVRFGFGPRPRVVQ